MSSVIGNKFANYRYDPISDVEVPELITAETGEVALLSPELSTRYGFELIEVPQSNPPGIVSVTRNSDASVFTYTASAPGALQYYIDYTNNSPVLIFNSSENGEVFTVSYNAIGAPDSVAASRAIEESTRGIIGVLRSKRSTSVTISADTTKTLSAKHASVYNLTVDSGKTLTVDQALVGQGVLHVYGDLTVNGTLSLKRTLLIVYGNILGTGTIQCPKNPGNGGNGDGAIPGPGAGIDSLAEYGGLGGASRVSTFGGACGSGIGGGGAGGLDHGGASIPGQSATSADANIGSGGGGAGGTGIAAGGTGGSSSQGNVDGTYIIAPGGSGGATGTGGASGGGGGGGYHLNLIVFGTIANTITLRSGLPGEGGNRWVGAGSDNVGSGGTTGNVNLWSQYGSAPCTVLVTKGTTYGDARDGADGTANYYPLDASSMFGILQDITKKPAALTDAGQIGYLFWTKPGGTF